MPSSPASSLVSTRLGHGNGDQAFRAEARIIGLELHESAVNDKADVVNGQAGLGNIG